MTKDFVAASRASPFEPWTCEVGAQKWDREPRSLNASVDRCAAAIAAIVAGGAPPAIATWAAQVCIR